MIYLNNDMRFELGGEDGTGVKDADGVLLVSATVGLTLKDLAGNDVAGISWPQTMIETDPGVSAIYRVVIDTASLTSVQAGQKVRPVVTFDKAGKTATFIREETLVERIV